MNPDVVVAGAGVGGAALALALASRHRVRVLLCEQHAGPGNLNRGDSLLPAVTAYLSAWGALDRCRQAGARELSRMQVYDRGRLLMEAPLFRPGIDPPYLVLAHPEIERVLVEAAVATGRVEVAFSTRVASLIRERGRCRGVVVSRLGRREEVLARLVVGADGSNSLVRRELGIPLERTAYAHSYFGIEIDRPAAYEDAMRIELSRAGGVLVVPTRDPGRVGLGVLVHPREEDLFLSGSIEAKMAAIWCRSDLFSGLRAHPRGSHLYRLARAHASRYVAPGAALLGDAVHVTNPTAGQGMTMAIEDAAALADQAGPAIASLASDRDFDARLARYEAFRRPKNAVLLGWSHWMSRLYASPGRGGEGLRRSFFSLGGSPLGRWIHARVWARVAARPILSS